MWIFLVVLKRMANKWTQNYNAVMSTACVDSQFTLCRCRCGRFAYFLTSSNRMNGKRMNSETSTKQLKAHWAKRQENIVARVSSSEELGSSYLGYKAFVGDSLSYLDNLLLLLCTSLRVSRFLEISSVPTDVHSGVALVPHFSPGCTAVTRSYLV